MEVTGSQIFSCVEETSGTLCREAISGFLPGRADVLYGNRFSILYHGKRVCSEEADTQSARHKNGNHQRLVHRSSPAEMSCFHFIAPCLFSKVNQRPGKS
jgi:hypothetical protein